MRALKGLLRTILWVVEAFIVWQVVIRLVRKYRPFPMPVAAANVVLDSPVREWFASAEEIVRRIGLRPGQAALEIGAGTGYIAFAAGRAVAPEGTVHALDVEPLMVERLRQRSLTENVGNVEPRLGDAAKLDFADDSLDVAYLVTALGEMPDKSAVLTEAYRVLKPGGNLSVTEILLDPDYMLKGTVIRLSEEAGFFLTEEHGSFLAYTANFRKPARRVRADA